MLNYTEFNYQVFNYSVSTIQVSTIESSTIHVSTIDHSTIRVQLLKAKLFRFQLPGTYPAACVCVCAYYRMGCVFVKLCVSLCGLVTYQQGYGPTVAKLKSLCGATRYFACTGLAAMGLGDRIKQGGAWLTRANNAVIVNFLDFHFLSCCSINSYNPQLLF